MAVVTVNNYAITEKITRPQMDKLKLALDDTVDDLVEELVENASAITVFSLTNKAVYDKYTQIYKNSRVGVATVTYNQGALFPAVGSDEPADRWNDWKGRWRHTSPSGKHPDDYRDLVNSGNSGWLFPIEPSWAGGGGYWDNAMEEIPTLLQNNLFKYGILK